MKISRISRYIVAVFIVIVAQIAFNWLLGSNGNIDNLDSCINWDYAVNEVCYKFPA